MAAARSLGLALSCVTVATGVGLTLGLVAAYAGRWIDMAIMRLSDLMLAFPGILLALLIAGFMGGGILPMLIGIKLTLWPQFARMARAIALGELAQPHVEAARLAGFPARTILVRHVLPAVLRQTMTLATLGLGAAIMSISALGFLGLGLQPPTPEWGAMISEMLPYHGGGAGADGGAVPGDLPRPCSARRCWDRPCRKTPARRGDDPAHETSPAASALTLTGLTIRDRSGANVVGPVDLVVPARARWS